MGIFDSTIRYILTFLLQNNNKFSSCIHYMSRQEAITDCKKRKHQIYILRSGFFDEENYGKISSMPVLPLKSYEGVRILFGEPREEWLPGNNLLIYADIIASAYFILSRYEEYIQPICRDEYGNYPAYHSVSYISGGGSLEEPLVDVYGDVLREKFAALGYKMEPQINGFSEVYFTHDIDIPFQNYSFLGMLRTMVHYFIFDHRIVVHPFLNWLGCYRINPHASWNYMLKAEREASRQSGNKWESVCFIIATEEADSYTVPYINDKKTRKILDEMHNEGAVFGLHTSYTGARSEEKMLAEKEKLELTLGSQVIYHRNHYLCQLLPSDMSHYEAAGFTDDFTTGFNEVVGFRLGTCHPVRFIDPTDGSLHNIILHPLLIMDCSLAGAKPYQMGLDFEQAKSVCKEILNQVWCHHGEVNVLFHNGMFEDVPGNYYKELYDWMIDYIVSLEKQGQE